MHEGTFIVHNVTSVYEIILILAVNVCIKSSSGSMSELVVANTQLWSPVCYLTCSQLNDIVIFCKIFYWGCFKKTCL